MEQENSLRWVAANGGKNLPEWQRSACIDHNETVFAPAIISGNEKAALLSASFDGEPMVVDDGHIYLRCAWLRQEYPEIQKTMEVIERTVRKHFSKGTE
jgi:hypothetical protein